MLDKFSNVHVEIAARIGELDRQPRMSARFFDKYQDRILFGTDADSRQVLAQDMYRIYYRFLETEDEYFDYASSRIPPQGRWRIYGLGLPESILRKVYQRECRARPRAEAHRIGARTDLSASWARSSRTSKLAVKAR